MSPGYHGWIQCLLVYHSWIQCLLDTTVGHHSQVQCLLDTTVGHKVKFKCLPDTTVGFNFSWMPRLGSTPHEYHGEYLLDVSLHCYI